jgi:hypothetical protein
MVATSSPTECLEQGDGALEAALSHLLDALEAFRGAGRPDLAAPLRSAVSAARQTEVLRRTEPDQVSGRDPADWFLE